MTALRESSLLGFGIRNEAETSIITGVSLSIVCGGAGRLASSEEHDFFAQGYPALSARRNAAGA